MRAEISDKTVFRLQRVTGTTVSHRMDKTINDLIDKLENIRGKKQ